MSSFENETFCPPPHILHEKASFVLYILYIQCTNVPEYIYFNPYASHTIVTRDF